MEAHHGHFPNGPKGVPVPIDTTVQGSPGWWMQRLFNMLANRMRRDRLQLLADYKVGRARLPEGAENARAAFEAFQSKARSNFAELIVSAVSERMNPIGFRTAVDSDATGDSEVGDLWERIGMDVECTTVHDMMLALGEAYVIVGQVDEDTGAPVVTAEDPRWMVGETDAANPRKLLAALKLLHDDVARQDRAYLYLPGEVHVASRSTGQWGVSTPDTTWNTVDAFGTRNRPLIGFDPNGWDWDQERSGKLPHNRIPVVKFTNHGGAGEYETHLDLLDRINHQILQRMIVATLQAFRQRAIMGLPLVYPEGHPQAGEEIDYTDVFSADPAALWQLPETAKMWESGVVDLRQILQAVQDDVTHLAACTRTPMHMLAPSSQNQSAEGANLTREGLTFKAELRMRRTSYPWAQVMSLALLHQGMSDRADLAKLKTIWAPAERMSLALRADAANKLAAILPRRTLYIEVLGLSPRDADSAMSELADDQMLAAQIQAAALAAQGVTGDPTNPDAGAAVAQVAQAAAQAGAAVAGAHAASGGSAVHNLRADAYGLALPSGVRRPPSASASLALPGLDLGAANPPAPVPPAAPAAAGSGGAAKSKAPKK